MLSYSRPTTLPWKEHCHEICWRRPPQAHYQNLRRGCIAKNGVSEAIFQCGYRANGAVSQVGADNNTVRPFHVDTTSGRDIRIRWKGLDKIANPQQKAPPRGTIHVMDDRHFIPSKNFYPWQ
jgi:hypothetical protein